MFDLVEVFSTTIILILSPLGITSIVQLIKTVRFCFEA